jgi:hypothetical protein
MLIVPLCSTAVANPNPLSLPGCATLCVDVFCSGETDLEVRFEISAGSVTFDDGKTTAGPFAVHVADGTHSACQRLCFKGAEAAIFKVRICVKETGTTNESCCPVNISVK